MLRKLVVILLIILISLSSTAIMIILHPDQNHSQTGVGVVEEEVFYPQKNFLLEDDVTYEEVKKMKKSLAESFPNRNTKYNLLAENEKLLYKISKTFYRIVKVRDLDSTDLISIEGYPGSRNGKNEKKQ